MVHQEQKLHDCVRGRLHFPRRQTLMPFVCRHSISRFDLLIETTGL